jgi:hypothetical protein
MKRETCLKKANQRMEETRIQRDLIASVPLNTPLLIGFRCPIRSKGWMWETVNIVCELIEFNALSIKALMIAGDNNDAYPFDIAMTRQAQDKSIRIVFPLTFKRIETWKPYNQQDLPLLLGWPVQYPRLADLLKGITTVPKTSFGYL